MNWFLIKLVFQIRTGINDSNHQFDESFRLIDAADISVAYEKAYELGLSEQCNFQNIYSEQIEWRFIDVSDVVELGSLKDGLEVFANTNEEKFPDEYIGHLHYKSLLFKNEHTAK